jgi:type IV pilus assembly protein PilW
MKTAARPERRRVPRADDGLTLIELLISIGILAVVIGILMTFLLSSTHQSSRTSQRADVQGGCRQALSLMTTEIRQAGADPSIPPAGIVGIVSADSVSIRVRSDLNGDGVIQTAEPSEDVTYRYSGTSQTLQRDPGTGAATILANVTAMTLTYFDNTGTQILPQPLSAGDAARVHGVGVTLTAAEGRSRPMTLTTTINLRNR